MKWWLREWGFPCLSLMVFSASMTYIIWCLSVVGQR